MKEKIKVLVLADHPFSPSGVGTQTRFMIDHLFKTGDYSFICLGGAVKHEDYKPQKFDEYGDDLVVYPVDGYGSQELIRSVIRTERPDILWFMTDPRFFPWLWEIEDEIRPLLPMVYYHVWDNYPYPDFNKTWYDSTDLVVAISKLTHDIISTVSPSVETIYHPHAVNPDIYKPVNKKTKADLKKEGGCEDKFVVFWNSRNARRKQSATLIHWFKEFLDNVGHEKAKLIMHTDPNDPNGPNLIANIEKLGLVEGEVQFSTQKLDFEQLAKLYAMSDVTVCISDAEGFGLSTLESLSCGVPIIVTMTGGLQEQVTDGENWFGIGIEPCSKAVIGSQDIPYIYEDRISKDDFINALTKIYNMKEEERIALGASGRKHVEKNYNYENYGEKWDKILKKLHKDYGSWNSRGKKQTWELIEI